MKLEADNFDYNELLAELIKDGRKVIIKAKIAELHKKCGEYGIWLLVSTMQAYQPAWKALKPIKQTIYKLCKAEIRKHELRNKLQNIGLILGFIAALYYAMEIIQLFYQLWKWLTICY